MECPYRLVAMQIGARLVREGRGGEVHRLTVKHDEWCPVRGGDGHKRCLPEFELDGVALTA